MYLPSPGRAHTCYSISFVKYLKSIPHLSRSDPTTATPCQYRNKLGATMGRNQSPAVGGAGRDSRYSDWCGSLWCQFGRPHRWPKVSSHFYISALSNSYCLLVWLETVDLLLILTLDCTSCELLSCQKSFLRVCTATLIVLWAECYFDRFDLYGILVCFVWHFGSFCVVNLVSAWWI